MVAEPVAATLSVAVLYAAVAGYKLMLKFVLPTLLLLVTEQDTRHHRPALVTVAEPEITAPVSVLILGWVVTVVPPVIAKFMPNVLEVPPDVFKM